MSDCPVLLARVIACRGSKESQRVFVGLVSFVSFSLHASVSFVLPATQPREDAS